MVEKLKTILGLLREDGRDVLLFAVLKIDDITDRWSIIYSEPGVTSEETRKETFNYLANILLSNLEKEDIASIARVGVFSPDNHLVANLLKFKAGYEIKESTPVNGNTVHAGFILESRDVES